MCVYFLIVKGLPVVVVHWPACWACLLGLEIARDTPRRSSLTTALQPPSWAPQRVDLKATEMVCSFMLTE